MFAFFPRNDLFSFSRQFTQSVKIQLKNNGAYYENTKPTINTKLYLLHLICDDTGYDKTRGAAL